MAVSKTNSSFFYCLNAVRVLSIISLILVFASSILVMVTNVKAVNNFQSTNVESDNSTASEHVNCDYIQGSTVPNQPAGVFWAVVSSLLIIFQTIILILSEVGWPDVFFNKFFPVLGSGFGSGALGIFQCLIGAQILSHHVDEFTLVAGFFIFSVGCLNMLLGLIFREDLKVKRSFKTYRAGSEGVLPTVADISTPRPVFINASPAFVSPKYAVPASDFGSQRTHSFSSEKGSGFEGYGFGRQGEKAAGLRGFILQKPDESLPRYTSPSPAPSRSPSSRTRSVSPSPPPSAPSVPNFPPPPPIPSTDPLRVQRYKSMRTSTSSFVSPGAYRQEHNLPPDDDVSASVYDDDYEDLYEELQHPRSSGRTSPPTFRSSPSAI